MEENKELNTVEEETTEDAALQEQTPTEDEEVKSGGGRKSMMSTKNGLYLRTAIGAMILYYAYTIVADIEKTAANSRAMLYVFVAIFGIAGIWIVIDSVKRIIKKEYED